MCGGWGEHRLDTSAGWADRGKRRVREHILEHQALTERGDMGESISQILVGREGAIQSKEKEGVGRQRSQRGRGTSGHREVSLYCYSFEAQNCYDILQGVVD